MEPAAALPKEETEDDFFDSWSKPNTPKSSNPGTPRISTPPIIGRSASAIPTTTNSISPPNPTPTPPSPRTLTSSAAARPARLGGTSRLNSASSGGSTTTTAPKKSKLGLGAAKTKPVDFAEAERKAIEEAERIKQLGYDREQEEKEEKARKETEALKRAQELGSRAGIAAANSTIQATTNGSNKSTTDPQKSAAFPRLGFGAIPGAGAAAAVSSAPTSSKAKYT
jgi:ADP-ribosylation factor GTPase-activating protein 2/3